MRRRGYILALVVMVMAALGVGGTVFANRVSLDLQARRASDNRVQALWLARSALSAGISGTREVETSHGKAVVRVDQGPSGASAQVTLADTEAYAQDSPPLERVAP